jgi:hypothetical protein
MPPRAGEAKESRSTPRRAQVEIVAAVAVQQREADGVAGERERSDAAHGRSMGHAAGEELVGGLDEDAHSEEHHHEALGLCGAHTPELGAVQHVEAEPVDQGIAEHVERVAQERGRLGEPAGRELHGEERGVHGENGAKDTPLALAELGEVPLLGLTAVVHRTAVALPLEGPSVNRAA